MSYLCIPGVLFFNELLTSFFFSLIILFIYFWLRWVFAAVRGPSLAAASGASPCHGARASHCSGLCRCGAVAPGAWASAVVAHRL